MKSFKIFLIGFVCISLLITSCATRPAELTASFVSPGIYNNYDCQQIALEKQRYTRQVAELTAQQDIIYNNDEIVGWVLAIGMLPAYFFIEGDGEIASELKLAKGTMEALQQVSVEKKCGM
tara:strand:+ start:198 stop:560 length:363 start_codon:yes stop_codon:yes gene_type:complete